MTARVSAVIAAYNYGRFLPRAIDSVLTQTYPHIECIVVDDGSTDETPQVLEAYAGRIRVLRQSNRGLSAARNAGIAAATGDYIALLDADDWWHPRKIERQIGVLEQRAELGCIGCGLEHRFTDGTVQVINGPPNRSTRGETVRRIAQRQFWIQGSGSGAVLRRSTLERVGGFDESLTGAEDWDMWLRIAAVTDVDNVPDVLVSIVRHGTGVFRNATRMETNQWQVYHNTIARWPRLFTPADRRRMRALILSDAARESHRAADALAYCLRSLKEWPFSRRRLREAVVLGIRSSLDSLAGARP